MRENDLGFSRIQRATNFPWRRKYQYKVTQITLKERLFGTGSSTYSLSVLEAEIQKWARNGYKLHSMSTSESFSKGMYGGDRIQVLLIFEKEDAEEVTQELLEEQDDLWNQFVCNLDDTLLDKAAKLKYLGLSNQQIYTKISQVNPDDSNSIVAGPLFKEPIQNDEETENPAIESRDGNLWIKKENAVYECPVCRTLTSLKCIGRITCSGCGFPYDKDMIEIFKDKQ